MAVVDARTRITPALLDQYSLSDSTAPAMAQALEALQDGLAAEDLTDLGYDRVFGYVHTQLSRLSKLDADRARHPEIAAVQVSRPIFITGAARSGTTFIHSLLSQDPQHRSPLTWEVEFPSPPPQGEHLYDDPRIEQWFALQSGPQASATKDLRNKDVQKKHLIGPLLPEECGGMLGAMLRNPSAIWSLARAKRYEQWIYDTQMAEAYRLHRRWLQQLQWRAPRNHWLLKYPMHVYALPELMAEYPDALVIQTHRAPEELVSSLASLIGTLRKGALAHEDPAALGHEMLETQAGGMDRSMAYRSRPDAKSVVDVGYREMISDPMAVVARVYDRLGINLTAEAEDRMQAFIRDNPQGKAGEHHHDLESYGLDADQVRERTKVYRETFAHLL